MKKSQIYKERLESVVEALKQQKIDLYLIITAEGCDPIPEFLIGRDTIGASAYLFTSKGKMIAITSAIDAQGIEESELFGEVIRYTDYEETLAETVKELQPFSIALNYSEHDSFCDGLTVGKYENFKNSLGEYSFELHSADEFIPKIRGIYQQ